MIPSRDTSAVLATLNEAINRQSPTQYYTAVYASLDAGSGAVQLGLGGHPHPL